MKQTQIICVIIIVVICLKILLGFDFFNQDSIEWAVEGWIMAVSIMTLFIVTLLRDARGSSN